MNLFKSLFIFLAPVWLIATLIVGCQLIFKNMSLMGVGMALTALPLLAFLAYILIFKNLARTTKNLYVIQLTSLLGLTLCAYIYNSNQDSGIHSLVLAADSYLITILYIYWYSNNGRLFSHILSIGKKLPHFTIKDIHNKQVSTADLSQQPALFMFTRGNWCPLCMAQINEVVAAYKELDALGVQVVIIASQPEKNTQDLAARFDVPFMFLIDKDQQLGKQLGIIHNNGLPFGFQVLGHESDQYYPTIVATDKTGTIIYSDQTSNYRVRPEPENLIKLFK